MRILGEVSLSSVPNTRPCQGCSSVYLFGFAPAGERGVPGAETQSTGNRPGGLGQRQGSAPTAHHLILLLTRMLQKGAVSLHHQVGDQTRMSSSSVDRYSTGAVHFSLTPKLHLDSHSSCSIPSVTLAGLPSCWEGQRGSSPVTPGLTNVSATWPSLGLRRTACPTWLAAGVHLLSLIHGTRAHARKRRTTYIVMRRQ